MKNDQKSASLNEIGLKYGTDKASTVHNYLEFYETFLSPIRNLPITVLEIGVLNGASIKTWEEYFPLAKIVGADIVPASKRFQTGRVNIELIDQSNLEELTRLCIQHGPFDLIIEDGSHMWEHQITSLKTLFPFLKNNGFYIVEDLQTNYGALQAKYKGISSLTCVEYLKLWIDLRVGDDQIAIGNVEDAFLRTYGRAAQFITFYRRACLIKKWVPQITREISAGQSLFPVTSDIASVPVRVVAHLSQKGDVIGEFGYVNFPENFAFQGIKFSSENDILEYRVAWADGSWSNWAKSGIFAGTKGESKIITGICIRISDNVRERYKMQCAVRFAGRNDLVEVHEGQDCTAFAGEALCGIQIKIIKLTDC